MRRARDALAAPLHQDRPARSLHPAARGHPKLSRTRSRQTGRRDRAALNDTSISSGRGDPERNRRGTRTAQAADHGHDLLVVGRAPPSVDLGGPAGTTTTCAKLAERHRTVSAGEFVDRHNAVHAPTASLACRWATARLSVTASNDANSRFAC